MSPVCVRCRHLCTPAMSPLIECSGIRTTVILEMSTGGIDGVTYMTVSVGMTCSSGVNSDPDAEGGVTGKDDTYRSMKNTKE